jgi:hypothetical protein
MAPDNWQQEEQSGQGMEQLVLGVGREGLA